MRRFLHSVPEAPQFASRNIVQAAPLVDPRVPQIPHFRPLGLGSLLQVQLPPSVELIAKRNSLAGILGSTAPQAAITSRLKIARRPWLNLFTSQPMLQQRVIGTSPLTCLVSASKNQTLTALELDGTVDWVVKSPIYAYTGRQLQLRQHSGWRPGSVPFGHTVVSGRGWLSFASPSSCVQINVAPGESVLVSRNHLNAFTIDTNSAHPPSALTHIKFEFEEPQVPLNEPPQSQAEPKTPAQNVWHSILQYTKAVATTTQKIIHRLVSSGNTNQFVEIRGPSSIFVSSAGRLLRPQEDLHKEYDLSVAPHAETKAQMKAQTNAQAKV